MKTTPLFALLALSFLGLGCKSPVDMVKDKASEKLSEAAVEGYLNSNLDGGNVDVSDGTVSYTGNDGATIVYGEHVKLPANFPSDLPLSGDLKISMASVGGQDGTVANVIASAKVSRETLAAWYEVEMKAKGWVETQDDGYAAAWYRTYSKGDMEAVISIFGADTAAETSFTMVVTRKD